MMVGFSLSTNSWSSDFVSLWRGSIALLFGR
jgi:hypothetical protein